MAEGIAMNRLYLDPHLIRAAHDSNDPHYHAARWLLEQIRHGELHIAVSDLTWRQLADDPTTSLIAATFQELGVPTLPAPTPVVGPESHYQVMQAAGIDAILSFDPTYDSFDQVTRIDPAALQAAEQTR